MAKNNSTNTDITTNADGGQIGIGIVKRILKWLGADITFTGSGSYVQTFPAASGTLVHSTHAHTGGDDGANLEWREQSATWTRTGNHTFTVSGDVTAVYRKGTKVRYKDGGAYEYGFIISAVYSAPNTTITLATNDDYAMASATITDTALSYSENPEGFPAWFNYANTIAYSASGSMTYTTVTTTTARFKPLADCLIEVLVFGTGTTGGTASTALRATAPVTYDGVAKPMIANYRDATSGGAPVGTGSIGANGLSCHRADIGNFGLGTGRIFFLSGVYGY